MAYIQQADYSNQYGERELLQVTDRENPPAGSVDDAVFSAAELRAAVEIDAAFSSGGAVLPIDAGNTLALSFIKTLSLPITRYHLFAGKWTEKVLKDYEIAMQTLRDIATGKRAIPGGDGSDPTDDLTAGGTVVRQYEANAAATFGEAFSGRFLP